MNTQDTSSSNSPRLAIFHVPIARDPKFHITFLLGYLERLWMSHHRSDTAPFHCICSENPCSILELLKQLGISKKGDIQFFLQLMEPFLNDTGETLKSSIKSSGRTRKTSKSQRK